MKINTSGFNNNSECTIDFHNITIIDPVTVSDKPAPSSDTKYYELSPIAADRLMKSLGLKNLAFNKTMYELSPDIWHQLLTYELGQCDGSWKSFIGLVFDGKIASITAGNPNYNKVLDLINGFISSSAVSYYHIDLDDLLSVYAIDNNGYGVLFRYYFNYNWITINYVRKLDDMIKIYEFKEFDGEIVDDIEHIINPDNILKECVASVDNLDKDFEIRLSYPVSINEMYFFFKNIFKIKLQMDAFDSMDYLAEKGSWLDEASASLFGFILNKFYTGEGVDKIYSANLKRSITSSSVLWSDLIKLLSSLVWNESLDVRVLVKYSDNISNGDLDYCYLHN